MTRSIQTTDNVVYGGGTDPNLWMTYTYNLSGALIEQQYPSGRVVKNTLESDGDLMQVQSRRVNDTFRNYANAFQYNAAGAVTAMRLGNGKWETTQFNSRLQPTQIGLGASAASTNLLKLNYDYGTTQNNGNVLSQMITVPTVGNNQGFIATQTYTYDSLNRIKDAKEMIDTTETWKQTFLYDRYGNRTFDTTANRTTTIPANCPTAVCNPSADPANNKLVGYQFDNSGNTKVDAENRTFIYDAENKQVQVSNGSQTIGQYFYDGDGKRVKKFVPSTGETTIFVYDAAGKLVAEYSTIVAPANEAKIAYLTNDHLGSPRINTDAVGGVIARHDYHPFGEGIATTQRNLALGYSEDTVRKQFTGYERDRETELDFAKARMYQNGLGRFTSSDPLLSSAELSLPQSWNRFSYAHNRPLVLTDPLGLYVCSKNTTTQECDQFEAALQKARNNLAKIEKEKGKGSKAYGLAEKALAVYGKQGEKNGVVIFSENGKGSGRTTVSGVAGAKTKENPIGQEIWVKFDKDMFSSSVFDSAILHEGSHAAYGSEWVNSGFKKSSNPTLFQIEFDGYYLDSVYAEVTGARSYSVPTTQEYGLRKPYKHFTWPTTLWNSSWAKADVETLRQSNIEFHLRNEVLYQVTPQSKELSFQKGAKNR